MKQSRRYSFLCTLALALVLVLVAGSGSGGVANAAASDLFFSEYIEGSSNNKALEIYNGTGAPVDLTGYSVQMFFNGSASAGLTINLSGTVADGDVFVLAHSSAVSAILDQADQTNGAGWYNGDDAVTLRNGTSVIDAVGQVGFDPGSEWGTGNISTQDNTLRRLTAVCAGDTDPSNAFDPAPEWDGFAQDTFDGLGSHEGCGNGGTTPAAVTLSEIRIDQPSDDNDEYFELAGTPDESLDGLTYLVIGDGTDGSGVVEAVVDLNGQTVPGSGFFVAAEGTFTLGTADLTADLNFENSDNVTHMLVRDFSGSDGDDLDTNDDGTLDSSPWSEQVDCVGLVETPGSGELLYCNTLVGPDGDFVPGHVYRCEDGWVIGDFSPSEDTPGEVNACDDNGGGDELCGDPFTPIYDIQGSGSASLIDGQTVSTEGIVVGDFQDNDGDVFDTDLGGFHIQDPTGDGNSATSDGIFVFAEGSPNVAVGDAVRVTGVVDEFFNLTELTGVSSVQVCSSGNSMTPTEVTLPVTSRDDFEKYEGMLVTFPQTLYISEYFNFDRFGEIVMTTERQFQPTAVYEPGSPEAEALAMANSLSRITLDDGRSVQNPDPAYHPNGNVFDLTNLFRGGDTVQNVTGVLDYSFGLYRIQPTTGADYTAANPRPETHDAVGGSLEVASFNVLNYFTTIDQGQDICGPSATLECRGADTEEELQRQRTKILAALKEINADIVGLIEIQNDAGESVADLVAGLNEAMGAGTYAYIDTGFIGTDAIKVAMIYKPAMVTPVGDYAILDSSENPLFDDTRNRPMLTQTFMENATGEVVTVAVNHLKSKGSDCGGPPDDDPVQGNCNGTRTRAAQAIVEWLATDPTGSGDPDFLIIGDLNAYDKEDPIDVLVNNGYTDLVRKYEGEFAYSYVFDGQLGYLDHALSSSNLTLQVTGATVWNINADEPDIIDYDMTFKQDPQDALYEPNAYRSSDHDPVIVGLDLMNTPPICQAAAPSVDSLWPPNHQFVSIEILNITDPDGDPFTINIDSIFQDEAVDAPDSGNTAPDGKGVGTSTAEVRAERVGTGNGRVYHITFTATDDSGASCTGTVQVAAPIGNQDTAVDDGPLHNSTATP